MKNTRIDTHKVTVNDTGKYALQLNYFFGLFDTQAEAKAAYHAIMLPSPKTSRLSKSKTRRASHVKRVRHGSGRERLGHDNKPRIRLHARKSETPAQKVRYHATAHG